MEEWIKKSDVVKALKPIAEQLSDGLQSDIASAIMSIPSADRPRGEWININTKLFRVQCSACKTWSDVVGNYCPWCGARMKGADDE